MHRAVVASLAALALAACGTTKQSASPAKSHHAAAPASVAQSTAAATGRPGTTPVPILIYHVINPPLPGAPFPGLYVPPSEFAAQMQALKAAGWHAVTLDQLKAYW